MDGVQVEPFHRGELVAVMVAREEERNCVCLDEIEMGDRSCILPNEYTAVQMGAEYMKQMRSIFYTDRIEAIIPAVVREGAVAVVPDIARPAFPEQVDFIRLRTPISYEIAAITKGSTHLSQNVKMLKKYILMNFLNRQ